MKKILAIAAIAVAATACTKTSVVYTPDQEIGFTPVSGQVTKAPVYGPMNETNKAYDTDETFGVFAYHSSATTGSNWTTLYGDGTKVVEYINNIKFVYKQDKSAFGGETAQYWPKTGSMLFAGYSPYESLNGKVDYLYTDANSTNPHFTFTSFTQGTYDWDHDAIEVTNQTVDVMWFDVNSGSQTSVLANTVALVFNHACSWLDFEFKTTDATSAGKFKILKVTLTNIQNTGSFVSGNNAAWTLTNDVTNIVIYDNDATGMTINETAQKYGNLLILPQALKSKGPSTNVDSQLVIQYQQLTAASGSTPLTETVALDLNVPPGDSDSWVRSKHYTYTVSFGLTEILILPTVTDWTDETAINITPNA